MPPTRASSAGRAPPAKAAASAAAKAAAAAAPPKSSSPVVALPKPSSSSSFSSSSSSSSSVPASVALAIEADVRAELADRAAERARAWDHCGLCTRAYAAGGTALLPCMDTVCRACAAKAVEQASCVQCPECYATHAGIATATDVRALPYNAVLEAELVAQEKGAATPPHRCTLCEDELPLDEALAVMRCEACQPAVLLCTFHVQRHQKLPSTKAHVPARLAGDEVHVASTLTTCAKHHEPLKVHCASCDTVVCYTCTLDGHPAKTHDVVPLDAAFAAQRRAQLAEATVAAEAHRDELVQAMVASRVGVRASSAGTHAVHAEIAKAFDVIAELVHRRRAELVAAAEQHGHAEARRLAEIEGAALQHWLSFEGPLRQEAMVTRDHGPGAGAGSAPVALAQVAQRLATRLQQLAALPSPAVVLNPPLLAIDDGGGSIHQFLAGLGRLVLPAFGPKCTLDVRALDKARAGIALVLTLVCRTVAGDRVAVAGARVLVTLRRAADNNDNADSDEVAVRPSENEDGTLALAFTPPAPGVYRLDVNVNGGTAFGCPQQFDVAERAGLYDFTSFTFTTAGATGARGPTLEQLRDAYGPAAAPWAHDPEVLATDAQGLQQWTVPRTGAYRLTVVGAHGALATRAGPAARRGGRGAKIEATVALVQGDRLCILVGQAGSCDRSSGGGGGASVVVHGPSNQLLVIAGGGGGASKEAAVDGTDACLELHGYTSASAYSNGTKSKTQLDNTHHGYEDDSDEDGGVALGHGGRAADACGGGGAGWVRNGQTNHETREARKLCGRGTGGGADGSVRGGYGGGGGGQDGGPSGGGGGGGYTGGNGGWVAGGGGSYVDPALTDVAAAVDEERAYGKGGAPVHGYVAVQGCDTA